MVKKDDFKGRYPSIAKITRPALTGILPRERLFKNLNSCRDKPVIWINGPPGSGKTTLIASYLDYKKIPCLWYQVDEGDDDISTFFYYTGLAAKKAAPLKRKSLPLLTPEYMLGLPTFTLRYFEDLFSRLELPFVIVFDNYQHVRAESRFHEIVSYGLSVIPEKINVILISRREPPPQLVGLRADNKMRFIGREDLSFTLDESKEILRMKGMKGLTDEIILQMHEKIKGWAAGLILMTERTKIDDSEYELVNDLAPKEIFDYFAREIFDKTDSETQDFLLKTAFLPQMTAQMATELTGIRHSDIILSDLSQKNFFTTKTSDAEPFYHYHPLFAKFLSSRAKSSFLPDQIAALTHSAAALLEGSGQIEDAINLLIAAANWEKVIQLILKHTQSFLSTGRFRTIEEWINKIPEELFDKFPWLLYWLGICRMPFNPAESRGHFEKAFRLFNEQKDSVGILLSCSGAMDAILTEWDDFTLLDSWIERLDNYTEKNLPFPSPEIEAQVAASMAGALSWRQPWRNDIKGWMEKALLLCQQSPNMNIRLKIYGHAIHYYTWTGEWAKCSIIAGELKRMSESPAASPLILLAWKGIETMMYPNSTMAYERSLQVVSEGLKIAEKSGIHICDPTLFAQGVYSSFNLGDMAMAGEFLQKLGASLMGGQRNTIGQYHFLTAWYNLLLGNVSTSLMHAEKALNLVSESGTPFPEFLCRLLMAQVLHEIKKYEQALTHLSVAGELIHRLRTSMFEVVYQLFSAQFAMDKGAEKDCLESLSKAMTLGKKQEFKTIVFIWRKPVMLRLCAKALEAGIEVDYVQDLIRKIKLVPDAQSLELESWPYPLKVYTFGRFGLLKDEKPVRFSGKVQQKPLSMLKAIIAFGGREISEDQLSDALWPEAAGDVAHLSFKSTLHRLRQLIGKEEIIQLKEGRITLDPRYCWVDVWAFQRIAKKAESLWKPDRDRVKDDENLRQFMNLSEKAISIYKGDFLSGDSMEMWTVSMREKLKNKFTRLVLRLCRYYEQTGQWDKVVEYCQRGLETDDLTEEFYQKLMTCYYRQGCYSDAMKVYQRCRKTLSAVMGVEPSLETEAIYKKLHNTK